MERIRQAADFIVDRAGRRPGTAVVLGSGLGGVADKLDKGVKIPFSEIPHFPVPSVQGHSGALLVGELAGREVVLQRGRVHAYEGVPLSHVVFPVRVLAVLGVQTLVLTNAAGGTADDLLPGDLMVLTDHLNLMGANPLTGPNLDALGPRFPDMTAVYDPALRELALACAADMGIALKQGVYAAMSGPSYETPAEIAMTRVLGAHAVGMSTVPEAIAARHAGVRVLAFSMISNLAAGMSGQALSHDEVLETGARAGRVLADLIEAVLKKI